MSTYVASELRTLRWGLMEAVRNRLGLTREEARRIFNQFRGRSSEPAPPSPGKDGPETGEDPELREVVRHMRETNQRLDHIEKDLEYLRRQVDRILERL